MRQTVLLLSATVLLAGCGGKPHASAPGSLPVASTFVREVATVRTGVSPGPVAVGDGSVWVANNTDGTVTRIDAAHDRRLGSPIRVGDGPVAIAAGEGSVWVALASGSVVRIDPRSGKPTGEPVPVSDPAGIAVGSGRVWVTSRAGDSVIRLDPRTGRRTGAPIRVGSRPTDIASGENGIWVANSADGTVTHIDPATGTVLNAVRVAVTAPLHAGDGSGAAEQTGGSAILALAVGEGAVWVAKTDGPNATSIQIRRIDPHTQIAAAGIPVSGAIPMRLAAGGGGVWITDDGTFRPGTPARAPRLLRIDPGTQHLTSTSIRLRRGPAGLAVAPDGVWVTNSASNTVSRIGASR